jgi:hypothetical protein
MTNTGPFPVTADRGPHNGCLMVGGWGGGEGGFFYKLNVLVLVGGGGPLYIYVQVYTV